MADDWQPPRDVKPWIVCAACRRGQYIVTGPRHFDPIIRAQMNEAGFEEGHDFDQGFIDQWGRFYTREEATKAVKESGQPFNAERNSGQDRELYSEGLY